MRRKRRVCLVVCSPRRIVKVVVEQYETREMIKGRFKKGKKKPMEIEREREEETRQEEQV